MQVEDETRPVREALDRFGTGKSRWRVVSMVVGALLLLAAVVVFKVVPHGASNGVSYQTQPVKRGDLVITVTATGNLEATNQVDVGSELSGTIVKMNADYNDTVKRSQPLAYLDDEKYRAAVLRAKAEVSSALASYRQAEATRNAAQKTLTRYRQMFQATGGKSPSPETIDQAEAAFTQAEASVAAAEAAIEMARATLQADESDLEKTIIYSPIDGFVLSRDVEVGQTVAASLEAPVLFTLAEDLRRMELQVDVDEADVGRVGDGQQASFTVDAYPERSFAAEITQVRYGAETTDGVVTYKAVLAVANPEMLLRPGMTATAEVVVQRLENVLLVPNASLRYQPDRSREAVADQRSLLSRLMPGPPRRTTRTSASGEVVKHNGEAAAAVWVLGQDHLPVRVQVEILATDGALTAISAERLTADAAVITNEITTGK